MSTVAALGSRVYCWCGRPVKNLYCEGCSSRPFICECFDGTTTKLSQQFARLPRLVQESFKSFDLSRAWQKTPAELTPEERLYFGSISTSQSIGPAPSSKPAAEFATVPAIASSAQVPRYFPSPMVRMSNVAVSTSVGGPIDLVRVAKAFPRASRFRDGLSISWAGVPGTDIYSSGRIDCPIASSEAEARQAIAETVRQLRQQKIKIQNEPVIQYVRAGPVSVFLGRGIAIQSLPERVPNSLYAEKVGPKVEGNYNRAGRIILLTSMEDVSMGMSEIRQGTGFAPVPMRGWQLPLAHFAYLRIGNPPVIAEMSRSPDIDGNMKMTGFVSIRSVFPSEVAALEAARNIDRVFEEAGILGPLTPREKITEKVLASDPRAFDYFANDPVVWAPGFMPGDSDSEE